MKLFKSMRRVQGLVVRRHFVILCGAVGFLFGIVNQAQTDQRLRGHEGVITALAFSPTGNVLATAAYDNTIRLWDLPGRTLRAVLRLDKPALELAFSPDGMTLAISKNDEIIELREMPTGKTLLSFEGSRPLTISADGKFITSGVAPFAVASREIKTGKQIVFFRGNTDSVGQAIYLRDGKELVTASRDGTVRFWDAASGNFRAMLPGRHLVYGIAVSPDGKTLAQAGGHKQVRLWDIDSRRERFSFSFDSRLYSVAFSPDGNVIAAGADDGVLLLDAATGKLLKILEVTSNGPVYVVKFSPDGKTLASTSPDHGIWLWNMAELLPKEK